MNENDLVTMLHDEEFLLRLEVKSLEKLVEKHPYFFIARALLARKNFSEGKYSPDLLHATALVAGDRDRLHHFMKEKVSFEKPLEKRIEEVVVPLKQRKLTAAETDNEELMDMLKSIHERKLAFLNLEDAAQEKEEVDEIKSEDESAEQAEWSDASIADSEFPMNNILLDEENAEENDSPSSEIIAMHDLELEMSEQAEFDLQEDLQLTNEISGAGAEFVPTEFLKSEDANEEFALEPDAEIQSMNVFEEEFVFHITEYETQEKEVSFISADGNPLQGESKNLIPFETQDVAEVPELISDNAVEIEATEMDSVEQQQDSELRINEHVASPGEFLPNKSYSFSQWLQFFKYDKAVKNVATSEAAESKKKPGVQEGERSFSATMQQELESIDRIVSSIHLKTEKGIKDISPEELAKKSLELNEEIVSETLAMVYEEQGRYDKAIRQYVKLSLIYPQKVSFFAARIKELKSKK